MLLLALNACGTREDLDETDQISLLDAPKLDSIAAAPPRTAPTDAAIALGQSSAAPAFSEPSVPTTDVTDLRISARSKVSAINRAQNSNLEMTAISPDRMVSFNFRDSEMAGVVKAVANQIGNLSVTVTDTSLDRISFVAGPIPLRMALVELANTLQEYGFTLERHGTDLTLKATESTSPAQSGQALLRPSFISIASLTRILQGGYPDLRITPLEPEQSISISGRPDQIEAAQALMRIVDSRPIGQGAASLIPLTVASAANVLREAQSLADRLRPTAGLHMIPLQRANAILVTGRNDADVVWLSAWLKRLDVAAEQRQTVRVIPVLHRTAAPVALIVKSLLDPKPAAEGNGLAPGLAPSGAGAAVPSSLSGSAFLSKPGAPSVGVNSGNRPTPTEGAPPGIAGEMPIIDDQRGLDQAGMETPFRISTDVARNTIVVSGTPEQMTTVTALIRALDRPGRQIFLQAAIIEVTLTNDYQFGIDFLLGSKKGALGQASSIGAGGGFAGNSSGGLSLTPASSFGNGLGFIINSTDLKMILSAIGSRSAVRLLSAPRLLVAENEDGHIQVGDQVPVLTQTQESIATSTPTTTNSITYVDTGIILDVTPRVGADQSVTLKIAQQAATAVTTDSSTINSPTIQKRQLTSTVSVNSGQTVALGGLMQVQTTRTKTSVPLLGDLPYVGSLFRTDSDKKTRTELLVLLTPRVIDMPQDLNDLTRELQAKISALDLDDEANFGNAAQEGKLAP